jgi:hypothetical protein
MAVSLPLAGPELKSKASFHANRRGMTGSQKPVMPKYFPVG